MDKVEQLAHLDSLVDTVQGIIKDGDMTPEMDDFWKEELASLKEQMVALQNEILQEDPNP